MRQRILDLGSALGSGLAALTSTAASICCIGPLAITLMGVNGAIFAAGLKPYRFYLLTVSAAFLALGFWGLYGRRKTPKGVACSVKVKRLSRVVLWCSVAIWVGALVIQFLADRYLL